MLSKKSGNIFISMDPVHRVLISFLLAAIVYFFIRHAYFNTMVTAMMLWDVFAFTYILTSWIVFFTSTESHITKKARKDDGSRLFVFLIVVLASFASMFTVLMLIISKDTAGIDKAVYLPVIITGMLLSWVLVHTTFCFHYAHLYYDNNEGTEKNAGGLNFPDELHPDYIDFAYFSFVIGMTFQVSDIEITSRTIRRQVLVHGLLSFALNTFVVALTINLIAGLKS
jgi:uncharacterized membrane protein